MDKRSCVDSLWISVLYFYGLLVLGQACQVDNGMFITTIVVQEETEIGTVVGSLQFDNPESITTVTVADGNPFFEYFPSNNSFVVKSRIDIDQGLSTVQLMILECIAGNGPQLEIEVEFELKDINDFSPEFLPSNEYTVTISEAAILGTQVALIEAKDRDIKNSHVRYELVPSPYSNYFDLNTVSGGKAALLLNQSLDYESEKMYNLTIMAKDCQQRQDCSQNQRSAVAQVTIVVDDADDLSPEFDTTGYRATIFEDSVQGTVVVQLVARDQDDLNEAVQYSIEGDGSQYFSINPNTGMVTVSDMSGMIRGTQYLLQAKAWQANDVTKRTSTSLVIKIVATNGNAPQFAESSYDVTLSEGSPVNTSALTFTVSDRDTEGDYFDPQTAQLLFTLTDIHEAFPFRLYITGWNSAYLAVSAPLDYERKTSYSCVIQVSDGEFMSQADVLIRVLNDNDNNPEFVEVEYEFEAEWGAEATIGLVKAVDRDAREDNPNPVTYKVLPPHDKLFDVDTQGRIYFAKELKDYTQSTYLTNVQAMDKGNSPRSATAVVKIILLTPLITFTSSNLGSSNTENKDRITIYIVAGIAGFLLILVALFVMCFLRRRAKKTAKQLRKKDSESAQYDTPYALRPSDTLRSATDSQSTFQTQIKVCLSDDQSSQTSLSRVRSGGSATDTSDSDNRNLQNFYSEHELSGDGEGANPQRQTLPNNLSVVSDSEPEFMDVNQLPNNSNTNILPVVTSNQLAMKFSSDSGRSSMKEERSPFMKRLPFQSFLHSKSASIDETGNHSQDEEIALATIHSRRSRGLIPTHSNSFNTRRHYQPDISNIRATEGPPIRTSEAMSNHTINSAYIAEAPEGFRTANSYRSISPQSRISDYDYQTRTSDYESNTPTPEITSNSIIDYCPDLPSQQKDHKPRLPMMTSNSRCQQQKPKQSIESLYSSEKLAMSSMNGQRSDTPFSDVSTETESMVDEQQDSKPQMTIYF